MKEGSISDRFDRRRNRYAAHTITIEGQHPSKFIANSTIHFGEFAATLRDRRCGVHSADIKSATLVFLYPRRWIDWMSTGVVRDDGLTCDCVVIGKCCTREQTHSVFASHIVHHSRYAFGVSMAIKGE